MGPSTDSSISPSSTKFLSELETAFVSDVSYFSDLNFVRSVKNMQPLFIEYKA